MMSPATGLVVVTVSLALSLPILTLSATLPLSDGVAKVVLKQNRIEENGETTTLLSTTLLSTTYSATTTTPLPIVSIKNKKSSCDDKLFLEIAAGVAEKFNNIPEKGLLLCTKDELESNIKKQCTCPLSDKMKAEFSIALQKTCYFTSSPCNVGFDLETCEAALLSRAQQPEAMIAALRNLYRDVEMLCCHMVCGGRKNQRANKGTASPRRSAVVIADKLRITSATHTAPAQDKSIESISKSLACDVDLATDGAKMIERYKDGYARRICVFQWLREKQDECKCPLVQPGRSKLAISLHKECFFPESNCSESDTASECLKKLDE